MPPARLKSLTLQELRFERKGKWPDPDEGAGLELGANFALSAMRLAPGRLGVEFEVTIEPEGVFTFAVSYRMTFEVDSPSPDQELGVFRQVAARIAPIVAFPYIRETLTSMASKAGAPRMIALPILNVGAFFDPDEIEVGEVEKA